MFNRSTPEKKFYLWSFLYLIAAFLIVCPTYSLWTHKKWNFIQSEFDYFLDLYSFFNLAQDTIKFSGLFINCFLFLIFAFFFLQQSLLLLKNKESILFSSILWQLAGVILIFSLGFPNQSMDVFFYIAKGWVESGYKMNVFTYTISEVPNYTQDPMFQNMYHPFYFFLGNYGSFFQFCMALITKIGGGNIKLTFIIFKLINTSAFLASAFIVRLLATKVGVDGKFAFYIFTFNPISAYNVLAAAHNDSFGLLFTLLGVYFSIISKPLIAGISLGIALNFKLIAAVLVPLICIYFISPWNTWGRWKLLLFFILGLLSSIALAYKIYPDSILYLFHYASNTCGGFYRFSIYTLVAPIAKSTFNCTNHDITYAAYLFFSLLIGIIFLRILIRNRPISPYILIHLCGIIFSYFFAISLLVVCEWYFIWVIAFAAISHSTKNYFYCYNLAFFFMPFTIFIGQAGYLRAASLIFVCAIFLYGTFRFIPIMGWLKGREPLD